MGSQKEKQGIEQVAEQMPEKKESSNYKKHTTANPLRRALINSFHKKLGEGILELESKSVLDIGCGEGFVITYLKNILPKTCFYGIDISPESIEIAKKNNSDTKFEAGNFTDPSQTDFNGTLGKNEFDLVICLEVLEHIPNFEAALVELQKINTDHYIFSVPNEPFFRLSNLLALKNIKLLGNDPEHVNNWTSNRFEKLIGRHFEIIKKLYPFPWQMLICKKKN